MTSIQAKEIIKVLKKSRVIFEWGLTDSEIEDVESKFNLRFPEDLKLFLQTALPVSKFFVNWRLGLESEDVTGNIISRMNWPLDGMIFDIKNNDFWFDQWGDKPADIDAQIDLATKFYLTYPKLVPIYSHRYIPSNPHQAGNPVFSVHQMDIIYYGYDLASYFVNEFKLELPDYIENLTKPNVEIEFWSYWTTYH